MRGERLSRGTLFLVVGPSGAGKDTLIDAARAARPDIVFPRRVITRSADAGGEDHVPATVEEFDRLETEGAFALSWRAHDLAYGAPAAIEADLAAGRDVLVNVSRAVVAEARERFAPIRVLYVTAPTPALAARLAERGRESAADIAERLARSTDRQPTGPDVVRIDNGGALGEGVASFLAALAPADARAVSPSGESDG